MTSRGQRLTLALWLAGLLACVAVIAATRFVADLSAFMPQAPDARQQLLMSQFREGIIGRLIMLGVEGGDAAERAKLSQDLAARLRATGLFAAVQNGDAATEARDRAYFFGNRYLLGPDITTDRFTVAGLHAAIADTIDALAGDAGLIIKRLFPRDPTGETLTLAEQFEGGGQPRSDDGVWTSRDSERAVLLAYTRAPGTDTDAQARAIETIRQVFAQLPGPGAERRLLMSGTSVFSVKSRSTIQSEVTRLAGASLLLVVCLLLLVYRSPRLLALGLVPVASGTLAGIAAVSLGFGQVHGLTMGFGTTLIGEAVDYAIYFFLQRSGSDGRENFWRTIWLGVATSIAGFAALLFSGFPGLAQLGVYTISGLVVAATVTRYVLPILTPAQLTLRDLNRLGLALDRVLRRADRLRWLPPLLAVAAVGAVQMQGDSAWNRNLAALSPIAKEDQRIDAQLRADLAAPDLRYMVAFTAANEERALQGAEKAGAVLRGLQQGGLLLGFTSPATVLPSRALQQERQAAMPVPGTLEHNLRAALVGLPVGGDKLQGFVADVEAARTREPLRRSDLDGTSASLLYDSLLVDRGGDYLVLMPLRPAKSDAGFDVDRIQAALHTAGLPGVVVIDVLEESTSLFENYRNAVLAMAEVGGLVIVGLLFAAFGSIRRVLRVVLPLVCAVTSVTALILQSGTQLTIMHLVGLLLMVAIGSNYALFFERSNWALDAVERRWMQVSLVVANLTTVGSFGVLGLSGIPVLSAIGSTVSVGALLSLVFSAMLSRQPAEARTA